MGSSPGAVAPVAPAARRLSPWGRAVTLKRMRLRDLPPLMLPIAGLTLPTLLINLVLPLGASAEEVEKGLDPVIAAAARATVAIEVDREAEPPRLSRRASTLRLPVDFVDYRRRPEGPAT